MPVPARHAIGVRPGSASGPRTVPALPDPDDDIAEALELRDELLVACRDILLRVSTPGAAALVAHIDALLDLDDDASPGSSPR